MPFVDEMSAKTFGPDYPKGSDLESKTVLALVNSHPSIDFPEPLSPNVIPVGGLQIRSPPKALPKVRFSLLIIFSYTYVFFKF